MTWKRVTSEPCEFAAELPASVRATLEESEPYPGILVVKHRFVSESSAGRFNVQCTRTPGSDRLSASTLDRALALWPGDVESESDIDISGHLGREVVLAPTRSAERTILRAYVVQPDRTFLLAASTADSANPTMIARFFSSFTLHP